MHERRVLQPDDPAFPVTPALRERLKNFGVLGDTGTNASRPAIAPTLREFTAAEKALIQKLHGIMTPMQLLKLLNDRLVADLGTKAEHYTIERLNSEISASANTVPAGDHDWSALRKLLGAARKTGLLDQIEEQTIDDFAVVFSLNTRQVLRLKDIILSEKEPQ